MNKKFIIIPIVILIILSIGLLKFTEFSEQPLIVEDITLNMPNGYHQGDLTKDGMVNITNGTNYIFVTSYNDTNITGYVNAYANERQAENQTVTTSKLTINNILVYKSVNNNLGYHHYWFINGDKVYTIFNWDKNPNIGEIVNEMISSMKVNN